tara:strand:+ start:5163 stop:5942 length:780 start_codon:yes stop_codon:yes gene_type:complete
MPGLLDYIVQDYENGGDVNPFDQSSSPTQSDVLDKYDINLTDDKYAPFIPTYDQTGENFLRTNYIQDRQGLYGGARSALGQLGQKSRETSVQQGFAGAGKSLLDTTRGDIVDQFGMDAQRLDTGLKQDIYGRRRDYDEDVLSAIADLPDDAYTIGGETRIDVDSLIGYQGDTVFYNNNEFRWNSTLRLYLPVGSDDDTTTLGFNPENPPPGGQNADADAPWNQPGYDPSNYATGASWTDTDGKNYIFNAADGSWLWDGF